MRCARRCRCNARSERTGRDRRHRVSRALRPARRARRAARQRLLRHRGQSRRAHHERRARRPDARVERARRARGGAPAGGRRAARPGPGAAARPGRSRAAVPDRPPRPAPRLSRRCARWKPRPTTCRSSSRRSSGASASWARSGRNSRRPACSTLLGIGGLGKSRLSLQVAAEVLDDFPDGVWFVELAPVVDPRLVPQVLASLLGVREEAGGTVLEALVKYVRDRCLLVILDNCEHLTQACAELARALLEAGPRVKVLASSREHLNVRGETTYPLAPLALPDPASQGPARRTAAGRGRASLRRPRDGGPARVRGHRAQRRRGRHDLPAARRHSARARTRRGARAHAVGGEHRGAPARPLPAAVRRRPHGAAAAADAARADRLELRSAHRARSARCSGGCRCSPAASRWRRPKRWAPAAKSRPSTSSTCSRASWRSRW